MASDGNLSSNCHRINITSKDIDQLILFKNILGIKACISWKKRGEDEKKCSQVQFNDVCLYLWFLSIGITPRKSLTIQKVLVPDIFFFDFLRGEFDGDVYSHAYWDTRWKSSVSLYMGFASGSKKYLEWIQSKTMRLAKIKGNISRGSKSYYLKYAKKEARILFQRLYYRNDVPFLKRKKDKLDRQWSAVMLAKNKIIPIFSDRGKIVKIA